MISLLLSTYGYKITTLLNPLMVIWLLDLIIYIRRL